MTRLIIFIIIGIGVGICLIAYAEEKLIKSHNSFFRWFIRVFIITCTTLISALCSFLISNNQGPIEDTSIPTATPEIDYVAMDKDDIYDLFSQYVHRFVSTVNYNDMSYLDGLFTEDNTIYDDLQPYIEEDFKNRGVREVIKDYHISNYIFESQNSYLIDTYELYEITTNKNGTKDSEFNTQYRVKKIGDKWYLSDITEEQVPYSY